MPALIVTSPLGRLDRAIVALTASLLGIVALMSINGRAVVSDSGQNLQMAVNLSHSGTISDGEQPPFEPSMYREPLPSVVSAAAVSVVDGLLGRADSPQYFSGSRAKYIKYQNVAWLIGLWLAVFAATRFFTGSLWWSIAAGLLAAKPFLNSLSAEGVNDLYTELPAAVFMTCAIFLLVRAVQRNGKLGFIMAGLCYGLLALTKAAMLYVFVGLVLVLLVTYVGTSTQRKTRLLQVMMLCASAAIVVTPWIARNWMVFGQPKISERSGLVLYTRALMDQVTPTEYRGTFYMWARPAVRPYVGSLLGFGPKDLEMGGRLQRLSDDLGTDLYEHDIQAQVAGRPQDAITLHWQARAERVRLEREFELQGVPHPEGAADRAMARKGMSMVQSAFVQNLKLAVPLMWRSAPTIFPALVIALAYGLLMRRYLLVLFVLPGLGLVIFYALATHFEPRPAIVAQSTAVIGMIATAYALWHRGLGLRLSRPEPANPKIA
jgi:hypothetical protein